MKAFFLALLLAASACATASPLPSFKSVPGYMTENHCDPFSKSAVAMLHTRGIPARRITYGWSQMGASGYHAAVLFRWEGRLYFMDNWRQGARPVAGKTDLGCIRHIDGAFGTSLWMTDEDAHRVAPREIDLTFFDNSTNLPN